MSNIINISSVGQDPSKFSCKITPTIIKPDTSICLVGAKLFKNDLIQIDSTNDTFLLLWGASTLNTDTGTRNLINYLPSETLKIKHGVYNVFGPETDASSNPANFLYAFVKALNSTQYCWWGFDAKYEYSGDIPSIEVYGFIKSILTNEGRWGLVLNNLNDNQNGSITHSTIVTEFTPSAGCFACVGESQLVLPLDSRDTSGTNFSEPSVIITLPNISYAQFDEFRGAGIFIITEDHYQALLHGSNDNFYDKENTFIKEGEYNYISFTIDADGESLTVKKNGLFDDGTGDNGELEFVYDFTSNNAMDYDAHKELTFGFYPKIDENTNLFYLVARCSDTVNDFSQEFQLSFEDFNYNGFRAIIYANWTENNHQPIDITTVMKNDLNNNYDQKIGLFNSIGTSPHYDSVDFGGYAAYIIPGKIDTGWKMRTHDAAVNLVCDNRLKYKCLDNNLEILQQRSSVSGTVQDWWYYYIPGGSSDSNTTKIFIDNPFGGGTQEYAFQIKNLQISSVVGSQFQGHNSNIIYHHFDGDNAKKSIIVNPQNPIYVKLTNSSDIVIDRLDIEITNLKNEPCRELEGTSFITLEFHENKTNKLIKQLIMLQNQNNTMKESTNHNLLNKINDLSNRVI